MGRRISCRLMSLFFDLFVQLVSDFRLQLSRLKWHRDSPRCLVTFAYDNMMHYTFLLAWVVSWKQLQYPSLRQVFQAPLSGNMAHGSKNAWGTNGLSAFIQITYEYIWHLSHFGTLSSLILRMMSTKDTEAQPVGSTGLILFTYFDPVKMN